MQVCSSSVGGGFQCFEFKTVSREMFPEAGLPMGAKKLRTTYPESRLDVLVGGHLREASLEEDLSARREHLELARVQNA